jgi:chemotaxis protein CheD
MTRKTTNTAFLYMGEVLTPDEPVEVTTIVGSCISVCLHDPVRQMGGICHFKSPQSHKFEKADARFGDIAISSLINQLIKKGSKRKNLKAMVVGGGNVIHTGHESGIQNINSALSTLETEDIPVVFSNTGGSVGRKIHFNTSDGSLKLNRIKTLNSALNRFK